MLKGFLNTWLLGCLWFVYLPNSAQAQSEPKNSAAWARWLSQQVQHSKGLTAAKAIRDASVAQARADQQPLYNPQLDLEYSDESDLANYSFGINQRFDWSNKRGLLQEQSVLKKQVAQQEFVAVERKIYTQVLQNLVHWRAADAVAKQQLQTEQQLKELVSLNDSRQSSGDLGPLEVDLALLSMASNINQIAQSQQLLQQYQTQLDILLPSWSVASAQIPEFAQINRQDADLDVAQWLQQDPNLMVAKAKWQQQIINVQLAKAATRPDPNVGVFVGRDDKQNVVGLNLSLPLHFNNDFSAAYSAEQQRVVVMEAQYWLLLKQRKRDLQASQQVLEQYQQRYGFWQKLMQHRVPRSEALLRKQWQSGDLATVDYLRTLQQINQAKIAGIELKKQFDLASITFLQQSGQMVYALRKLEHGVSQ